MKKINLAALLLLTLIYPIQTQAGVTETRSFKLSVTLPEHPMAPQGPSRESALELKAQKSNPDIQLVEVRRMGTDVLLKTYVAK